jgi:Activator of Hsp90 ATPase homolog 1-like protein
MIEPLIKTIEVPCGQAEAFRVFVHEMGSWWPLAKRSMSLKAVGKPAKSLKVEPHLGGRIIEIGPDGTEHHWGTIRAIDPHNSVAMDFHMGMPPEQASLVEVVFVSMGEDRTRVTLTQSNWEGFGDMAEMLRMHYGTGWDIIFAQSYFAACGGVAATDVVKR